MRIGWYMLICFIAGLIPMLITNILLYGFFGGTLKTLVIGDLLAIGWGVFGLLVGTRLADWIDDRFDL
jgi:hypothetical protein